MLASAWLLVREPGGKIPRAIAQLRTWAAVLAERLDKIRPQDTESTDPEVLQHHAEMMLRCSQLKIKVGHIRTLARSLGGFKDDVEAILDALEIINQAMMTEDSSGGVKSEEGAGR